MICKDHAGVTLEDFFFPIYCIKLPTSLSVWELQYSYLHELQTKHFELIKHCSGTKRFPLQNLTVTLLLEGNSYLCVKWADTRYDVC